MKQSFSIIIFLIGIILLPFPGLAQTEEDSSKSKGLAGINSHLHRYEQFLKDQEKDLYQKLYIEAPELEGYLALLFQDLPDERSFSIEAGKKISFRLMSQEEIVPLLKGSEWKPMPELRHPHTHRTFQSTHNQYIIQFYDNSGVWVSSEEEFNRLASVHFDKSENGSILWWATLNKESLDNFLKEKETKRFSGPGIRAAGQRVYQVSGGKFILAEEDNDAKLFENKLILLRYLSVSNTYETEAKKLLVNNLLQGTLRPELYSFLFYLNPVQLKEVLQVYGATPIDSIDLAENKVAGYQFSNGSILYHYPGYGFCRLFENKAALNLYKSSTIKDISDPEFAIQSGLSSYGASFPRQIPALTRELAKELNLDPAILDGSEESLAEVGAAMKWNAANGFNDKIYLYLLGYVGEVYRKKYQGDWDIQLNEETRTWIPAIRASNGKLFVFSAQILQSIVEGR